MNEETEMLEVREAIIKLSEQTVRELISAVDKAKANYAFDETIEIPNHDMTEEAHDNLLFKKGIIKIKSNYSKEWFIVKLETTPQTQESLGYRLIEPTGEKNE